MPLNEKTIHIVGAGFAGSECAYQLAQMGYRVRLHEMRSQTMTPAHKTNKFAELVCSNSFGSLAENSAPGQLKWEAEQLGSLILQTAKRAAVPAGQALGVDREVFSQRVTEALHAHPRIEISNTPVMSLDELPRPAVIATGPLTHESLAQSMQAHFGDDFLYFFDAIAPIIDAETINTEIAWKADRYDKGTADYYNCPMDKFQYLKFVEELKNARKIEPKEFEVNTPYFESCMPVEAIVERGPDTLRFGPMKPKGLRNPKTGREPYAVVQLRQDNAEATAYNMVGFQTKMAYGEQVRVFRTIPGLEQAEFLKLGCMHRNLYIHTPKRLNKDLSSRKDPWLFFAGQITGVEGYFESTCIGLLVAHFIDQKLSDRPFMPPPRESSMGSLLNTITDTFRENFQPMNMNFSLFPRIEDRITKQERRALQIQRARVAVLDWRPNLRCGIEDLNSFAAPTNFASANSPAHGENASHSKLQIT